MLISCASVQNGTYQNEKGENGSRTLTVWMLSDIQPRDIEARKDFEQAIADTNQNVDHIDLGVIAGDLLKARSRDDAFEWFLSTRGSSKVEHWYEIAGNHDIRSKEYFDSYFRVPPFYAVEIGNVLLLLLSDQSVDSKTSISDEGFSWWRQKVENNQDRILFTVTHAQLRGSGLLGSVIKSRQIENSHRFEELLRAERVALWSSGHSHLPQGVAGTISIRKNLGATCFINVSSIDSNRFMDSQSRFFIFTEDSSVVWVRSRNHTKERYEKNLDYPIALEKPFVWDGSPPRIVSSGGPGL